jgi:hypothetical protein
MSKRLAALELETSPERAYVACPAAIRSLEWSLDDVRTDRLMVYEDPARLPCREWPAEIEIEIDPAPGERTALTLAGFVPGLGPISSRHLKASLASLEGAIRRQLG